MNLKELYIYSLARNTDWQDYIIEKLNLTEEIKAEFDLIIDNAEHLAFPRKGKFSGQLKSIFEVLKDGNTTNHTISSEILSIDRKTNNSINTDKAFENLTLKIKEILFSISDEYSTNLLSTIQRYGTYLYAYNNTPDITNIYDFLKIRAAFVQCIAIKEKSTNYPYQLLCGDISGIQNFIFDIHSNKAAKSLKGRSFYLQMVSDCLMYKILNIYDLPFSNIIYTAGGKFYLLLPNSKQKRIKAIN